MAGLNDSRHHRPYLLAQSMETHTLHTPFPAPAAVAQTSAPHLRVKELQAPAERTSVPASSRRSLHLLVFLRKGFKPVVKVLTGSSYDGMPQLPQYTHVVARGKVATYCALSAQEYIHHLDQAWPELAAGHGGQRTRGAEEELWLLHDKAKPHQAAATKQYCRERSPKPIRVITLPTDSPDLTPCDSSFFAVVKGRWKRGSSHGNLTWEERVQLAFKLIDELSPDKFIDKMPLRWKACKRANGWHIEQELHELKAEQAAA